MYDEAGLDDNSKDFKTRTSSYIKASIAFSRLANIRSLIPTISTMIDHVVVKASKALFDQTVDFYQKALTPTGYTKMRENPSVAVGFGETMPDFWVFASDNQSNTAHVALRAKGSYSHLSRLILKRLMGERADFYNFRS
jgi:hypothetical protein